MDFTTAAPGQVAWSPYWVVAPGFQLTNDPHQHGAQNNTRSSVQSADLCRVLRRQATDEHPLLANDWRLSMWTGRGWLRIPWGGLRMMRKGRTVPTRGLSTLHLPSRRDLLDSILGHLSASQSQMYPYLPPHTSDPGPLVSYVETLLRESADLANKNEMLTLLRSIQASELDGLGSPELEQACLDNFQNWVGQAKVSIGYLLYAQEELKSADFLTRLVSHLGGSHLNSLNPSDFVTLLLIIYFRGAWTLEELGQLINTSHLQSHLALCLERQILSSAEICAIGLGLKRIQDFEATNQELRLSLYEQLVRYSEKSSYSDIDQLAILQLCLLIGKGQSAVRDDPEMVSYTLNSFSQNKTQLDLSLNLKLVALGLTNGAQSPELTQYVMDQIMEHPETLNLRVSVSFLNFMARIGQPDTSFFRFVWNHVKHLHESASESATPVQDLVDTWSCARFCSLVEVWDDEFIEEQMGLLKSLPSLSSEDEIIEVLFKGKNPGQEVDLAELDTTAKTNFCRTIVQIEMSLAIDHTELYAKLDLDPSVLQAQRSRWITPVLNEAIDSTLPVKALPRGMRQLVRWKRALEVQDSVDQSNFDLVSIIPILTAPNIIFGHIGGNLLSKELLFQEHEPLSVLRAPLIGEWVALFPKSPKQIQAKDWFTEMKIRHLQKLGFSVVELQETSGSTHLTNLIQEIRSGRIVIKNMRYDAIKGEPERKFKIEPLF